jgi:hypothetical protein
MFFLSFILFAFNIFTLGWVLIPYALVLIMFGWVWDSASMDLLITWLSYRYLLGRSLW